MPCDFTMIRVALSPFDSRHDYGDHHLSRCRALGLTKVDQHPWMDRLLGERPTTLSAPGSPTLLFAKQGFGLCLRRFDYTIESLSDHGGIASALIDRAQHHRDVRNGVHGDVRIIQDLKQHLTSRTERQKRQSLRPDIWEAPPYTLSFFYIPVAAQHLLDCSEALQGLSALLEPSQVLLSELADGDNKSATCESLICTLNVDRVRERMRDADLRAGSATFCSWAGIVIFDGHQTDLPYFESLEIRLQFAWMKATFVRKWAEMILVERLPEPERLTEYAAEVTPILRQTRRLIDATASTRDQQLFDELIETSELAREIAGAEEALGDVRAQIEIARESARRRYSQTIEALLFVLAVLQALPLVFDVPLVTLPELTVLPLIALVTALAVIRSSRM